MKTITLLLLVSLAGWAAFRCTEETKYNEVEFSINAPDYKGSKATISIFNLVTSEQTTLASAILDSVGRCTMNFPLIKPTFANLEIEKTNYSIFLEPGFDLKAFIKNPESKPNAFNGKGHEVNDYLSQVSLIQKDIERFGNKDMYALDMDGFLNRLDSMKKAFHDFHQNYTDSVTLPENLDLLMAKINAINLIRIKQTYAWNYGIQHNYNIPEKLNVLDEIPFDTTLLNSGYGDYALAISIYMNLKYYYPSFLNKTPEENKKLRAVVPVQVSKEIEQGIYPLKIKEYLQAKNVNYWMSLLGLTPSVDTIYKNYKERFPASPYMISLEHEHNQWLALSSGKPAPNFNGTTQTGKNISLSDLSGKMVYIDVWATWCVPCREEIPFSKTLQKKFKGDNRIVFLNVSIDRDKEAWKKMVLSDRHWGGIHINLQGEQVDVLWKSYKMRGVPTYILIDQNGNIVDATASRPSEGTIANEIQGLLNKI